MRPATALASSGPGPSFAADKPTGAVKAIRTMSLASENPIRREHDILDDLRSLAKGGNEW
jgi:hypothetical protein